MSIKLNSNIGTSELFELAGTSGAKLSIANHTQGFMHVIVELDGDAIVSAWIDETTDGYYANTNPNIQSIISVGSSAPCNCDACSEGDDPAEWADSAEFWPDFDQQVYEFVQDFGNGTYTA